jgi:hypothetical protein
MTIARQLTFSVVAFPIRQIVFKEAATSRGASVPLPGSIKTTI